MKSEPAFQPSKTSVGVIAPAIMMTFGFLATTIAGGEVEGGAANELNASIDAAASGVDVKNGSSTRMTPGTCLTTSRITSIAPGTVVVHSTRGNATMRNFFDREARIFRG